MGVERPGCAALGLYGARYASVESFWVADGLVDGSPKASVLGVGRGESLGGRLPDLADALARWWHAKLEAIAGPQRCRRSVGRYSALADVDGGHDDLDDVFHEDEFSRLEV